MQKKINIGLAIHILINSLTISMEYKNIATLNKIASIQNLYDDTVLNEWLPDDEPVENKKIIKQICFEHSCQGYTIIKNVENNPGDNRSYGNIFPSLPSIQYAYLTHLKNISRIRDITVVNFGDADGRVSLKARLAIGSNGLVIVNDLSALEIKKAKTLFSETLSILNKKNNAQFDIGSLFNFLKHNPHLKEKVDVCYIQNVEHFMNPLEHQQFVHDIVYPLLKKGGHIFCTAHTIESSVTYKGNPYFELYQLNKKQNIPYPLFAEIILANQYDPQTKLYVLGSTKIISAATPHNDKKCDGTGKSYQDEEGFWTVIHHVTHNKFTPTIYKNTFGNNFECIESFFMDHRGKAFKNYSESNNMLFATYIGQKK